MLPPTLSDGVVTLRAPGEQDIDRIVEQCREPEMVRWTTVPHPYGRDDATRFVRHGVPGEWEAGISYTFAIEYDGQFCGSVGLRMTGASIGEIYYGIHSDIRGTGAAERACRLLIDWGFSELSLHTIQWFCLVGNWASRKLAWRLGFSCHGPLTDWLHHRDTYVDAWVGALTKYDAREPRGEWFDVPCLEGSRVRLRRTQPKDIDRIEEGTNDPITREWVPSLPDQCDRAEAARFVAMRETEMAAGTAVHWVVADRRTDQLLAVMSVLRIARPNGEIGYWTHPDARGRGLTSEAVRLAAHHAFNTLGLRRLSLNAACDNRGSTRVAENAGFVRIGVERDGIPRRSVGLVDCAVYELLPEDLD